LLEKKIEEYLKRYGVDGINKVIHRHDLSTEKRTWFTIRFASQDPQEEANCTEQMDNLTRLIDQLDQDLLVLGINEKNRPSIIKDLKKYSPDGWSSGFAKKDN
jgi:hypothetical protein